MRSVTGYITSTGRKVSQGTIGAYVDALVKPYIFYPAQRFNVEGKNLLSTNQKYYIADLGIRRHILPKRGYDLGHSLENVIFLELVRRGCSVTVGKVGDLEVDFIATKDGVPEYCQVTASMTEQTTFEREMVPLERIRDNYRKTVLTLDRLTPGDYNGIRVVNALDWLLGDE